MKHATHIHGKKKPTKEQEYLAGWQRERADLENFKKRMQQQRSSDMASMKRRLLEPLLDVADNFNAVTKHLPQHLKKDTWALGVTHVARKLDEILSAEGVSLINQTGVLFDPQRHEALMEVKGEGQAGQVLEVITPGYALGEYVLRPAKVKVSV